MWRLIGQQNGDNPHFWYSPDYVNQTTKQMELDLISIDPSNAKDYEQNYANLQVSLSQYQTGSVRSNSNSGARKSQPPNPSLNTWQTLPVLILSLRRDLLTL